MSSKFSALSGLLRLILPSKKASVMNYAKLLTERACFSLLRAGDTARD